MHNYLIYDEMGTGKHSVVHRGRKKKSLEFVTLKSFDKCRKDRVFNEVQIIHNIKHPNILNFHNWYETRNHYWIIYEYCAGGDLRKIIQKDQYIIEPVIKAFARDLVNALTYLHSNGIVFCDLKPKNIILNEYSEIKLCDFALCQRIVDMIDDANPKKVGTPYYMAPELFEDAGVFSFSSDIWSLGILMHEMATGETPFLGDNFAAIARSIVNKKLKDITGYSDEFNHLLSLMLEKNPANRIKWSDLMKHPWWGNVKFGLPDLPAEPHFEVFLQKYGYLQQLDAGGLQDNNEILGDNDDIVNRMRSEKIPSKGKTSDASIMRMSLNVGKNLMREKEEIMNVQVKQNIKIDRDQIVDMREQKENNNTSYSRKGSDISKTNRDMSRSDIEMDDHSSQKSNDKKFKPESDKETLNVSKIEKAKVSILPGREDLQKYLMCPSDRVVRPIIGNVDIEALDAFEYNPNMKPDFTLVSNDELEHFSREKFEKYMTVIYQFIVNDKVPNKSKLNVLHYFVNFIQNSENANMIIESFFLELFIKMLRSTKAKPFKIVLCTIVGLLLRYTTNINNEIAKQSIPELMINLIKDRSQWVKRRAIAALGEYLFFGATQLDGTEENEIWDVSMMSVNTLIKYIKSDSDVVMKAYAMKTVENITSQSQFGGIKFCTTESLQMFIKIYNTNKSVQIRTSAIVCVVNICHLNPEFINGVVENIGIKQITSGIEDGIDRIKQALITLLNLYLFHCGEKAIREVHDNIKSFYPVLATFFDHRKNTFKGKGLLLILLMITFDFNVLSSIPTERFVKTLDKIIANEQKAEKKSRYIKCIMKEYASIFQSQLMQMLEFVEKELPRILESNSKSKTLASPGNETGDNVDLGDDTLNQNVEFIDSFLTFISMTLQSLFIQQCVMKESTISRYFKLLQYIDYFSKFDQQVFQEISGTILMIIENLVTNKTILILNAKEVVMVVLPYLAEELKNCKADARFVLLKVFTDIYAQISKQFMMNDPDEESQKNEEYLKRLTRTVALPLTSSMVPDKNPVGVYAIKLVRFILEYDPECGDYILTSKLFNKLLSYFEINHEKCNANTIKVICLVLEGGGVDAKNLMKIGFMEKLQTLYTNITDIVQGEEILELVNSVYRLICNDLELSKYSVEAARKVSDRFKKLLKGQINCLVPIHMKSVELLSDSQGIYLPDILECLLATDLLLKGIDLLEDEYISKEFTVLLLENCISTDDPNVIALTAHLVHLLCQSESCLRTFKRERRLGEQLLIKIKNENPFNDSYYFDLFNDVFMCD